MSLIAVEAAITIADPSTRQALIDSTAPVQKATRDDEPGCIVYCFAADPCQDDLIQVYELWESQEALAAHLVHPNYLTMREMLGAGGLTGAVSRKHRIDASAPVYNADHVPSASFD
ncbi:putative quinol monooxygenase [Ilumatobacter sp.]|uniref:putative quinol monooxygenase n=1 Tax=Ilumatobacter sp. TaxID=1967498 RepID=UPI003C5706BC